MILMAINRDFILKQTIWKRTEHAIIYDLNFYNNFYYIVYNIKFSNRLKAPPPSYDQAAYHQPVGGYQTQPGYQPVPTQPPQHVAQAQPVYQYQPQPGVPVAGTNIVNNIVNTQQPAYNPAYANVRNPKGSFLPFYFLFLNF